MAKKTIKAEEDKLKEPTESQKVFCRNYVYDWNGTKAYMAAYPDSSEAAARSSASELLTKANIKAYLEEIQADLEKLAGISRLQVVREHQKLAFSSIAHLHNTWIERKEFDQLTSEQKDSIAEISTQTRRVIDFVVDPSDPDGTPVEVEFVKVKLYDKQKSLDSISRMLGYDEAQKVALTGIENIKSFKIVPASDRKGNPNQ